MRLVTLSALFAAIPVAVMAQDLTFLQKMELNQACGKDIETLCGTVERGDGRLMACVQQNVEKLSQPCHDTIQKLRGDLLAQTGAPMDF